VLLVATQRRHLDAIEAMCEAARIEPKAITSSALALGRASCGGSKKNVLVLSVGTGASELTTQQGAWPDAIKHLRTASAQPPFVNELRRAVSTMRVGAGAGDREMILWGHSDVNPTALGEQLGLPVRVGELASLGVDTTLSGSNGDGGRYASAVALGMAGLDEQPGYVDFLHSRLAPPQPKRIPRWAFAAGGVVLLVIIGFIAQSIDLGGRQGAVDLANSKLKSDSDRAAMQTFVAKVSMAKDWFVGEPRYEACMRDLILAVPNDGETYATSLELREPSRAVGTGATATGAEVHELSGTLSGRTLDKDHVIKLLKNISAMPQFTDLNNGAIDNNNRSTDVSFSIQFTYKMPAEAGAK